MKIKLDENLPDRLVRVLSDLRHGVDTVVHERLACKNDFVVWSAAQQSGRFGLDAPACAAQVGWT